MEVTYENLVLADGQNVIIKYGITYYPGNNGDIIFLTYFFLFITGLVIKHDFKSAEV